MHSLNRFILFCVVVFVLWMILCLLLSLLFRRDPLSEDDLRVYFVQFFEYLHDTVENFCLQMYTMCLLNVSVLFYVIFFWFVNGFMVVIVVVVLSWFVVWRWFTCVISLLFWAITWCKRSILFVHYLLHNRLCCVIIYNFFLNNFMVVVVVVVVLSWFVVWGWFVHVFCSFFFVVLTWYNQMLLSAHCIIVASGLLVLVVCVVTSWFARARGALVAWSWCAWCCVLVLVVCLLASMVCVACAWYVWCARGLIVCVVCVVVCARASGLLARVHGVCDVRVVCVVCSWFLFVVVVCSCSWFARARCTRELRKPPQGPVDWVRGEFGVQNA